MSNLVIDDDLDDDSKDLFVTVDNPEKHVTAMESYVTFRVNTKTSRPEYDGAEFQQRRRFNDFVWIRERLEYSHPSLLVPPLPEKHSLKRLDRFSQEFVHTRMCSLQKFLQRISDHPVLSCNKYFQTFLTAKQHEFQAAKKEGTGFFSRVSSSFHNMSASYMMKSRGTEFDEMTTYIQSLGEKLAVIERISQRILKEQSDYLSELNDYGPVFTLWSNAEETLHKPLTAVAKAVGKNYMALQTLMEGTEHQFAQPLKEYILYTEAIKGVLRRRDAIQMEYEMTVEELKRKKAEKDQHTKTDERREIKGDVALIKEQIKTLGTTAEQLQDKSTCADSDLKADMERWHKTKKKDCKKIFMDMCDRNIAYYEQVLNAWEDAIPHIQQKEVTSHESKNSSHASTPMSLPDKQE